MAGPAGVALARHLRQLEARARQGKTRYSRAAVIQDANAGLSGREDAGGGLALKPQTVSDWFTKGRVPEDFRQLWAFAEALIQRA